MTDPLPNYQVVDVIATCESFPSPKTSVTLQVRPHPPVTLQVRPRQQARRLALLHLPRRLRTQKWKWAATITIRPLCDVRSEANNRIDGGAVIMHVEQELMRTIE